MLECCKDALKQHDGDVMSECRSAQALARLLKRAEVKLEERYRDRGDTWLFLRPWKCNKELVCPPSESILAPLVPSPVVYGKVFPHRLCSATKTRDRHDQRVSPI